MSNHNRFFPIFPDGEDSAPAPSGSNSRSKKPAAKRSRQETPSPPNAPAPLAIEAPPPRDDSAITSRLDEIELTLRKHLIRMDTIDRRFGELRDMFEDWDSTFGALHQKLDGPVARPAPAPAPAPVAVSDPRLVEAITALSKKVDDLLERSTAAAQTTIAPAPESQHLAALTKQVTAVSQQLTSLTARHSTTAAAPTKKPAAPAATTAKPAPPAATTAKPARAATTAKPARAATTAPAKTTTATTAENADSAWKPVVSRQTKRRQQIYPPAERRIVVQLSEAPINAQLCADAGLRIVNRALVGHPDVTVPPLYTAYVSRSNALVLTAGPRSRGRDYEPFLGIILDALSVIPTVSAHVSQRWTRYVLNGIPTATTPEDAREEIEMLYPAAKLAKTPRWLTTAENRQSKTASSMVITLVGPTKLRHSKMSHFNRECDVREYIPFRDTTQCSRCQRFGHPAALCKAAPACAVCAQPHLTHQHPCNIPGCPKGRRCAHPPLCCALCQQPHKATDRSCPAFLALARSEDPQPPDPIVKPCPTPAEDMAMNEQ
jgi:hypothetical protein